MRKTELQKVIAEIENKGFSANEVKIENKGQHTHLTFVPYPNYFFTFLMADNTFTAFELKYVKCTPRINPQATGFIEFEGAIRILNEWLSSLKWYEHPDSIPDPLEQYYAKTSQAFADIKDDDKASFSITEKRQILEAVNKFQILLEENFNLTEQGKGFIKDKLKDITEPTERVKKGEWKTLAQKAI